MSQKIKKIPNTVAVYVRGKKRLFHAAQILFLEGDHNYCRIHFLNGSVQHCACTLAKMEKRLTSAFFRIHKQYIVNLHYWANPTESTLLRQALEVKLVNGPSLMVARRRKSELCNRYRQLVDPGLP